MRWQVWITVSLVGKVMYHLEWLDPRPACKKKKLADELDAYLATHRIALFDQQYFLHPVHPFLETPCLTVWVARGDEIVFASQYPFAVHFDPISPAGAIVLQGGKSRPASCTITDEAPFGRYSCFVALCKEGVVYTDDPDIIVDPNRPKGIRP